MLHNYGFDSNILTSFYDKCINQIIFNNDSISNIILYCLNFIKHYLYKLKYTLYSIKYIV